MGRHGEGRGPRSRGGRRGCRPVPARRRRWHPGNRGWPGGRRQRLVAATRPRRLHRLPGLHRSPTAAGRPNRGADCGARRTRSMDRRTKALWGPIRPLDRPVGQTRTGPTRTSRTRPTMATRPMVARASVPPRQLEPGRPHAAPIPGRPGRPGTQRRGSRPPGGQALEVQAPLPRSSGAGGRADPLARPGRRRRRRTGTLATCPRSAALGRSSSR